MQAVRRCSVCAGRAARGHLRNQTDVSLLQTSCSGLRRVATCVSFRSSESALFSSRVLGVQKFGDRMDPAHKRSFCSGSRASPAAQVENLSHDSLISRAASLVTNSSSTFLSQSTLALTDALSHYSKAVYTRIAVQRRYLASLGKLTPAEEDSLKEVINNQRAQISDRLDACKRFESTWINAVNLCKLAAEAAHASGAEQGSIMVRTHIQVAQSQVEEARKLSEDADKKLAETKVEEIQRKAEYAALQDANDEYELHEAYLRED